MPTDPLHKKIPVSYLRKKALPGMKILFHTGDIKIEDEGQTNRGREYLQEDPQFVVSRTGLRTAKVISSSNTDLKLKTTKDISKL